jgi:hypothetical protein
MVNPPLSTAILLPAGTLASIQRAAVNRESCCA